MLLGAGVTKINRAQDTVFLKELEPKVLDLRQTALVRDASTLHRAELPCIEIPLREVLPPDQG